MRSHKKKPASHHKDPFYNPEHLAQLEKRAREMDARLHIHAHELLEVDDQED